ncbi:acyltransferase domain-containing protein, partial [Streptosporangium sp. NPDC001682]
REGEVSVAAVNGPASVVIAGVEEPVLAVAAELESRGIRTKRLRVSHAFHSPLMDPMLEDFRALARTLSYGPPQIPVVSTVTGQAATDEQLCSPDYWVEQVRGAVRFADGVRTLHAQGVRAYLELGPDGVLAAMAADTLAAEAEAGSGPDAVLVPVLRGGQDEQKTIMMALAGLHVHGVPVSWPAMLPGARRVELPTYAFQKERFWPTGRRGGDARGLGLETALHPLLGAVVVSPESGGVVLTGRLSASTHPWICDHEVLGRVLLPGTGFVELVVRAGDEVGCAVVEELALQAPLVLPESGGVRVQVVVDGPGDGPGAAGRRAVRVYSRADGRAGGEWTLHAQGVLAERTAEPEFDLVQWPPAGAAEVEVTGAYERLAEIGYGYGPAFQALRAAWRRGQELFAEVVLGERTAAEAGRFGVHPALLDAAM